MVRLWFTPRARIVPYPTLHVGVAPSAMSPEEKRDAELRIRLTPAERAALDNEAQARGVDTSTWTHALLLAQAERPKRA